MRVPYADSGPPRRFGAFGGHEHAREGAETLREVSREAQGAALGQGEALSGPQE